MGFWGFGDAGIGADGAGLVEIHGPVVHTSADLPLLFMLLLGGELTGEDAGYCVAGVSGVLVEVVDALGSFESGLSLGLG